MPANAGLEKSETPHEIHKVRCLPNWCFIKADARMRDLHRCQGDTTAPYQMPPRLITDAKCRTVDMHVCQPWWQYFASCRRADGLGKRGTRTSLACVVVRLQAVNSLYTFEFTFSPRVFQLVISTRQCGSNLKKCNNQHQSSLFRFVERLESFLKYPSVTDCHLLAELHERLPETPRVNRVFV